MSDTLRDRVQALECEVSRLRRERDEARAWAEAESCERARLMADVGAVIGCEPGDGVVQETERLRRDYVGLWVALRNLIVEGHDLARLMEQPRGSLADVDAALLAWARAVASARGAMHGGER